MNWITNFVRPKIKNLINKGRDTPENLWRKCPACGEMIFHRDLIAGLHVCPKCGYHMRIGPAERFAYTFDANSYRELPPPRVGQDPLNFKGEKRYTDEMKAAKAKTGRPEAFTAARGTLDGLPVLVAVQPFDFLAGSLGLAVGEAFVQAVEVAVAEKRAFILYVASGGARMQESMFSLMQMPRTTIAVQMLKEAGLPYVVVFTDPTFGGVSASYAMLGDIQIAEPGAQIGFAGARVIAQTIREKLPEGFQRAEYLLSHGMLDMVTPRSEMRATLSRVLHLILKKPKPMPCGTAMPPAGNGDANGNGHAAAAVG
ncbi:MAG TPA: acetyl-CoA carboxylase, carboxyltransferase subunit beta [Rhizomicrobium sp.]|nr:acetyl-CoA carboxylase, carboxyltransferase subunit beta [Rhizomicrobium sp.]